MNTNRKVKVTEKTKIISEMSNQIMSLDYKAYGPGSLDVEDGSKVHVILVPESDSNVLLQSDYAMSGIEMESMKAEKGMTCISFGGLLGRFKLKDTNEDSLKWYIYIRKGAFSR